MLLEKKKKQDQIAEILHLIVFQQMLIYKNYQFEV
jgi:hypothetical protein